MIILRSYQHLKELTRFYLFANHAILDFDDAIQDKKLNKAMDEESKPSKRMTFGN